jgi:hypothetical protein
MTILRERTVWVRERPPRHPKLALTREEQDQALRVLWMLCKVHKGMARAAVAIGTSRTVIKYVLAGTHPVSAKIALRLAKIAQPAMGDMLAGRWPTTGACPYCGQRGRRGAVPTLLDRVRSTLSGG